MSKLKTILFGSGGSVGSSIKDLFINKGSELISISRNSSDDNKKVFWDVFLDKPSNLMSYGKFNSVCFAQGLNFNDSIRDFNFDKHIEMYKANCLYIVVALNKLIEGGFLENGSKICIVSSIWQNIARQNKMSYCITKSALKGLVNSLSIDLSDKGFLVNAILPSALDTPMTQSNLNQDQIDNLKKQTYFNKLASVDDVANLAYFLCSGDNSGITGQFINVDLGFLNAKII